MLERPGLLDHYSPVAASSEGQDNESMRTRISWYIIINIILIIITIIIIINLLALRAQVCVSSD